MEDKCFLSSDSQAIHPEVKYSIAEILYFFPFISILYDGDIDVCCIDRILEHFMRGFFQWESESERFSSLFFFLTFVSIFSLAYPKFWLKKTYFSSVEDSYTEKGIVR